MTTQLVEATAVAACDDVIETASAVPVFPPRPDAIATLVTSDEQLEAARTLLYSIKKSRKTAPKYPPELLVMATPNVALPSLQDGLVPDFCTRIITVSPVSFPSNAQQCRVPIVPSRKRAITSSSSRPAETDANLTLIGVFSLLQYDTILFIDVASLVVNDVYSLLDLGKVYTVSDALIAAAPDTLMPDKFDSAVMVVRPDRATHQQLMAQRSKLVSYDGTVTGYLNAFFADWYKDMPPMARLGVEYNAQSTLYDMTLDTNRSGSVASSFWEVNVAPKLRIVHFSDDDTLPWRKTDSTAKDHPLHALWKTWNRKSANYRARMSKERNETERRREQEMQEQARRLVASASPAAQPASAPNDAERLHRLISRRFKELRAQGVPRKDAMEQAQAQYQGQQSNVDATAQVAAMFGLR